MKYLAFLLLFICSNIFAQKSSEQNLIDTALRGHGSLFLHSKPLIINRLDPNEMWYYIENVRNYSNQKLDTVVFSQIIHNSRIPDTTLWSDIELPNFLLINSRYENVSKKYMLQKYNLKGKKQTRHFLKYVNKFNSTDASDRIISYYSRPVFDNTKTFAIVEWDNGHNHLAGGGGIILYQLHSDNKWKEFGIILNWRY